MPAPQNNNTRTQRRAGSADLRVRSESYDAEAGTVEIVYATPRPVGRRSFREVLAVSDAAIVTDRIDDGAVYLIRDHMPFGDPLGRIVSHRVEGDQAIATVQLSASAENAGVVADIQSGVIRSVSVGYLIHDYSEELDDETGVETRTVTRWEPYEISLTVIPADTSAAIRSDPDLAGRLDRVAEALETAFRNDATPQPDDTGGDTQTTDEPENPASPADPEPEEEASMDPEELARLQEEARSAERSRISAISELATRHGLGDAFVTQHTDAGSDVDAARAAALDAIAERSAPDVDTSAPTGAARVTRDERETLVQRAEDALMSRMTGQEPSEMGREFRGYSLSEMARQFAGAGGSVSASRAVHQALSTRSGAHGTSDFALALSNVVNKSLMSEYESEQRTYEPFVRVVTHSDLKGVTRLRLGEGSQLKEVQEGGEYEHGTVGETGESYTLRKFGRVISVTEEALINDDLGALESSVLDVTSRIVELENDTAYKPLIENEKMSDGKSLFNAAHGNLLSAGALTIDALSQVRAAGRKQKGVDGGNVNVTFVTLSIRSIFGFAHADALAGEPLVVIVEGVFHRTVQAAADVSHGDEIFFDEAAGEITTDSNADANRSIGYATADAVSDGATASVGVKLV